MSEDDSKPEPKRQGFWLGVAITGAAVAFGVVHAIWPHLKIDSVTVVMVVIALVPWIGGIVQNIELPGGFKVGLREAQQAAAAARAQAEQATSTATVALSAVTASGSQSVDELVAEYERIRAELPSGSKRTNALDKVVGQLISATTADDDFDWREEISSPMEGRRIAALAFALSRPDEAMVPVLNEVIRYPMSAFEQFWALRALGAIIDQGFRPDIKTLVALAMASESIDPASSRGLEMKRILEGSS